MATTTDSLVRDQAAGAARGRWLMLIVLLAGQFMALLDVTVVNVAMPTIGRSLHASGAELQLVVAGYFWRRLPSGLHHLLAPAGCLVAVGGYVGVALTLRSGGHGGLLLQVALIVTGASLALGFSPLVTHALVRVPLRRAADASGLLTTTIQLGQAAGVATFGSLFLTLDSGRSAAAAVVSGHALAVTLGWLAAAMVLGAAAGIPLARTVAAARRPVAGGLAAERHPYSGPVSLCHHHW